MDGAWRHLSWPDSELACYLQATWNQSVCLSGRRSTAYSELSDTGCVAACAAAVDFLTGRGILRQIRCHPHLSWRDDKNQGRRFKKSCWLLRQVRSPVNAYVPVSSRPTRSPWHSNFVACLRSSTLPVKTAPLASKRPLLHPYECVSQHRNAVLVFCTCDPEIRRDDVRKLLHHGLGVPGYSIGVPW